MHKIIRKALALSAALTLLPVMPAIHAAAAPVTVTLDPSDASPFNGGRFEGWGTSLCWWANRLGYSEKMTEQAAELFFSEDGLGLDIARYNLGGGDDPSHNHITRSDSKIPGYATGMNADGGIVYDWSADENQRNIALAALKANPDLYFEGFSNSPPYFMTNSGCTSGAESAGENNLRDDMYDDFARFIAETTKHFKDDFGIEFKSYSPMNEPDTDYWGKNSPKQEGCHFDAGESESKMITETRKALDKAGLRDVLVAGMDETSIDTSLKNLDLLSGEAADALGRIDTHTYGGSKRAELKEKAVEMNKTLWMSEVDNGGTSGTNAGDMGAGLNLADRIVLDMNGMQPAAWVLWDIVDFHRDSNFYHTVNGEPTYTEKDAALKQDGGLWGVGMGNHDTETIELSQKYYAFGQFTRYINPGDTIIASSDRTLAAYNKDTGSIKIVAVNTDDSAKNYTFDMSAFSDTGDTAKVIRTSGSFDGGEHWADAGSVKVTNKKFTAELIPNSVTTFIIENNAKNVGYVKVGGARLIGMSPSQYTAVTSDSGRVAWSVSDTSIASIDMNGLLTPKKEGIITVSARSASLKTSAGVEVRILDAAEITPYSVTGSDAWNKSASSDAAKAADGDLNTYFDGLAKGYVTLDLGDEYEIGAIAYAPRKGFEYRTTDSFFEGSADGADWTRLYTVPDKPDAGKLTYVFEEDLAAKKPCRYIRYTVPEGKHTYSGSEQDYACNIAEVKIMVKGGKADFADILTKIRPDSEIYGNVYMPSELNGAAIRWQSSDESVITDTGEVTRGAEDKNAVITAVVTRGENSVTEEYPVTVKAKTETPEMGAYLFVHFVGTESDGNQEQIYFSVSKDGTTWKTLNDLAPILVSGVGEKGVRDPHIIRSPEGDRFFIVATDLSIYNRRDDPNRWGTCQREGSRSVVIWESKDLINWSPARLVKIAADNAGCAWAPESVYDDEKGSYMVFWASKTADDDYKYQRIYRSYTRDFKNFTEPEVYIDDATDEDIKNGTAVSNIDTTFIKDGGTYYRYTKNESKSSVIMEKSGSLDGEFSKVATYKLNGEDGNAVTGYEGPTAYKINGENKWCLLLDYYSKSAGYKPFVTNDISVGDFASAEDFRFDSKYRHGTVMPITSEEYEALIDAYTYKEQLGAGDVIYESDGGEFKDKDFAEIKNDGGSNVLKGLDEFTVSFDSETNAQSWWFYAAPNADAQVFESEKYIGILDSGSKISVERYNSSKQSRTAAAEGSYTKGVKKHVTAVFKKDSTRLYIDGMLAGKADSKVDISDLLGGDPVVYIGKANWGDGEYSNGEISNFKIYNYAMSADQAAMEMIDPSFDLTSDNGKISYKAGADNAYICVYNAEDKLIAVKAGQEGEIELAAGEYKISAYMWNNGMQPLSFRARQTVTIREK